MSGKLYVIGTPIGNMGDMSLRAVETLNLVETLVCEDTRVTARLVNHYVKRELVATRPRYFAYNEFNEDRVYEQVLEWLREGKQIGLVSDAGMPTLSDPGYRVVSTALAERIEVEVIPGPTALTTALAWSGIGGEVALYLGFLPKGAGKAGKLLASAARQLEEVPSTRVVLYVSPHRLVKELVMIREAMGEVRGVVLREMTKRYQERVAGSVSELIEKYQEQKPKGEIVLVVAKPLEK